MGSSCSRPEYENSPLRHDLKKPYNLEQPKQRHSQSTTWYDRCSIALESFSTNTKRILPKKSSSVSGCKTVVICRIFMEKKDVVRTPSSISSNKGESKLSCVLRMPRLDWESLAVKVQYPRLLPMNLWPGETYVFGFLTTDSQSMSHVTLEGKVGNEKVCIKQQVSQNPNFSADRWKQIGDLLEAEMRRHKITFPKEPAEDAQKRDSRDTGYMSYRYSSDASQKPVRHDDSTDSNDEMQTVHDKRLRCRRKDTPSQPSPMKRYVHTSYKKRVEDSKLVEERESSCKSTDDNKSASSTEKKPLARKQTDDDKSEHQQNSDHQHQGGQGKLQDDQRRVSRNLTGSITNIRLASEVTSPSTEEREKGTSSAPGEREFEDADKSKLKARKKKSAFRKMSRQSLSFKSTDTNNGDVPRSTSYGVYISQLIRFPRVSSHVDDSNTRNKVLTAKLLKQGYRYHKLRTKVYTKDDERKDETTRKHVFNVSVKTSDDIKWSNVADDADDADDEIDEDLIVLTDDNRPTKDKLETVSPDGLTRAITPTPYSSSNLEVRRVSFSDMIEKQDKSLASPKKYRNRDDDNVKYPQSPRALYFALHKYGVEGKEAKSTSSEESMNSDTPLKKDVGEKNHNEGKATAAEKLSKLKLEHNPKITEKLLENEDASPVRVRKPTPAAPPTPILRALENISLRDSPLTEDEQNPLEVIIKAAAE